ncbi:MAG: putative delta-60 repeat protein, partial [Pirellulaceae bacterium]
MTATSSIAALLGNRGADGFISLREAIIATNNTANIGGNPDEIHFSIAGAGPHTINISAAGLPDIGDAVIIDGSTEPDFVNSPVIVLDGSLTGAGVDGMTLADGSDGSTIRSLVINNFGGDGIQVDVGADGNTIAGNYIGTDVSGSIDLGNSLNGVNVGSSSNLIGGLTSLDHNVISGNNSNGVSFAGTASNNVMVGNFVGLDATGSAALSNFNIGIEFSGTASNNTIGGRTAAQRNIISGNPGGVLLNGVGVTGNTISGNYIGTDVTGTAAIGGMNVGISMRTGVNGNTIGGVAVGAGNLIAYSAGDGISFHVDAADNNAILQNVIHSNTDLGIDLANDGVTANDSGDVDTGANDLQNFPILTSVDTDGAGVIRIEGTLNSTAASNYRVEFFASAAGDGTGFGEGERYLGYTTVTTDGSGDVSFNVTIGASVAVSEFVSATATEDLGSGFGSTSEFALNVVASSMNDAPTFAPGDGTQTIDIGGFDDVASAVALQADGKIVVVGEADSATGYDIVVARHHSDGTLDSSFGTGGIVTTAIGANSEFGHAIVIQPDGKILVAGNSFNGSAFEIAVARYNSDGSLDTTFSGDGIVTTPIGPSHTYGFGIALQDDGRIVVVGNSSNGGNSAVVVVRYLNDGTLDSSFSGDGIQETTITSGFNRAESVALQSDGLIVVAGTTGLGDFAVLRYLDDGNLDTSFSGDGIQTTSLSAGSDRAYEVRIQSDGKIAVAGVSNTGVTSDIGIARYNADGTLDTSFSGDGLATTDFTGTKDSGSALLIQTDGKLIVAGETQGAGGRDFAAVRYNADGTLDTSFDVDGRVTASLSTFGDFALAAALQADERLILVGGALGASDNFAVARFNTDGSLDKSYDSAFISSLDGTATFVEGGAAVVLDADVQIFDEELSGLDDFNGATLTLARNLGANTDDVFSETGTLGALTESGSLVVGATTIGSVTTNSGGTLLLTFDNNATNALVNSAMQQIAYGNSSGTPPTTAQIDWTFDDGNSGGQGTGGALSATGNTVVTLISNTLIVDTTSDVSDGDTSSIANLIGSKGADGFISLREAILAANNTANVGSPDEIHFNIAGAGVHTIAPTTLLPIISDAVVIDGLTQGVAAAGSLIDGTQHTLLIELSGASVVGIPEAGLDIRADDTTVRGLIINNWTGQSTTDGIQALFADNVTIEANYIGTSGDGSTAAANTQSGINLFDVTNSTISNNLASGNNLIGIALIGSSSGNVLQGNLLGTDASGGGAVANAAFGIQFGGTASGNLIGGTGISEGNLIAFNANDGIEISGSADINAILGNQIHSNAGIGIDLGIDSVTNNDADDVDTGANDLQNFPILTSVDSDGAGVVRIEGTLNSTAATNYRIEFFASTAADGTGYGEGERYLGYTTVTTDGSGDVSFNATLGASVAVSEFVSATATEDLGSGFGSTSEFALNVVASSVNSAPMFAIGDGTVTTTIGSSNDAGQSVYQLADGRILVAGYAFNGSDEDFVLVRHNADGMLDTSFGIGGKVVTTVGASDDYGVSVTVQSDGKALVAGYSNNGSDFDFALVRYNINGLLDTSFSGDGIVTTDFGSGSDFAQSVVAQPDGKIVVAGYASNGLNNDFAVVRYNSDGSLDTSFSGDGMVTTAIGSGQDFAYSAQVDATGKITVAGASDNGTNYDFAVVRYSNDGSLDSSFSGDGLQTTAIGAGHDLGRTVVLQGDGKVVVSGYSSNGSDNDFTVVRYDTNGTLDTGFSGDGIATFDSGANDTVQGAKLQTDGKILVAGSSFNGTNNDFSVVRFSTNGTPDTSFSGDGLVATPIGADSDDGYGVDVDSSGRIVVAGQSDSGSDYDFALVRYLADGSLDTSFDSVNTLDGTPTFIEGGSAVVLDANIQVSDVELSTADDFNGATLTLARNGGANADDVFSETGTLGVLTESGSLIVGATTVGSVTTNSGGTLLLTFNGNATNALVDSAMQQIAYSNSNGTPPPSAQIDWTFNDGNSGGQGTGGALSATGNAVITLLSNTLIVDTTSDVSDGDTSSIANLVGSKGADGFISLREAILATNNTVNIGSPDEIHFNIAGVGPHSITVSAGGLPNITDAVIIDGTTDPDFVSTPIIELDGSGAGAVQGLRFGAGSDGSTIRGLVINQFGSNGILIAGTDNHTIVGNFIGVDVTGTLDRGNAADGVHLSTGSSGNVIGGTTAADRNVISGNTSEGVHLLGATNNTVLGNYIGVDEAGMAAIGNTAGGIRLSNAASANTIGGAA